MRDGAEGIRARSRYGALLRTALQEWRCVRGRGLSFLLPAFILCVLPAASPAQNASPTQLSILYPKHQSLVGKRVNVVLDPLTDWSSVPQIQVRVGNTTYPVIDTASGRHALQGIALEPGMNTITVSVLTSPLSDGSRKGGNRTVAARTVAVYSRQGGFMVTPPAFTEQFFHAPDRETLCAGCHRMEAGPEDRGPSRPERVLCHSCHREVATGKYVHGPAALGDCLVCHDPERRPARYQFGASDPWSFERSVEPVSPAVFTISGSALFAPGTATLISDAVPAKTKERQEEVRRRKEQERALFQPLVEHLQQNPGDKVLLEAHVDKTSPLGKGRLRTPYLITTARARAVEKLLRTYGVAGGRRVTAKGMGISLPKGRPSSAQDRQLNERIEIVAHPPGIAVPNSQQLPSLDGRERVTATLGFAGDGSSLRDIKVVESLPAGAVYVRGTGIVNGSAKEPRSKANELEWAIGRLEGSSRARITYMIKRTGTEAAPDLGKTAVRFSVAGQARVRQFSGASAGPASSGATVQQVCARCHGSMAVGPFTHGPVAAGYCTLCHDPHGSDYSSWTRKESWSLCTTCHGDKRDDKHLIRGGGSNIFHPTRRRPDPLRPGKTLACESCHSPHSAYAQGLLILEARGTFELCRLCHRQK